MGDVQKKVVLLAEHSAKGRTPHPPPALTQKEPLFLKPGNQFKIIYIDYFHFKGQGINCNQK